MNEQEIRDAIHALIFFLVLILLYGIVGADEYQQELDREARIEAGAEQ
jgi:hypothetical protein